MAGEDIFRTQADTRFNSFADPMNPINQNPGNWGVNPAYLTPAYAAPYRPQYTGEFGTPYGSTSTPGWGKSFVAANPVMSFAGSNYGGNTYQQQSPYFSSLTHAPVDSMMSISQKLIVPTIATMAAMKYTTKFSENVGGHIFSSATRGVASGFGASAETAATLGAGALKVGRLAGNLFGPMAIAQAGVSAADAMFFDPFIANRQMADRLQTNFQGQTYSGIYGNKVTGGGLNRSFAANISNQMNVFGTKDTTFNRNEIGDIVDFASRSGMMDNATPDQFVGKFKSITRQVKAVMQLANTSDFKEAIELMSKLQQGGVSQKNLSTELTSITGLAAQAGVSVNKLMNGIGAQGQYLYAANGMTPYLGQQAMARSYASFAAAQKTGLIAPELMAQMGGVEGAAQSALGGRIGLARSPYAHMIAMNILHGQGAGKNITENAIRFGGLSARDPLQTAGEMELYDGLASSQLAKNPMMGQEMVMHIAKQTAGAIGSNGKLSAEKAFLILKRNFQLSDEQAKATIAEWSTYGSSKDKSEKLSGLNRQLTESRLKYMEQQGLDYGVLTSPVGATKGFFRGLGAWGSEKMGNLNENVGSMTDKYESWKFGVTYGNFNEGKDVTIDELLKGKVSSTDKLISTNKFNVNSKDRSERINASLSSSGLLTASGFAVSAFSSDKTSKIIEEINGKAQAGDSKAIDIINLIEKGGTSTQISNAMSASGFFKDRLSSSEFSSISKDIQHRGLKQGTKVEGSLGSEISRRVDQVIGGSASTLRKLDLENLYHKIASGQLDGNQAFALKEYQRLTGKSDKEMSGIEFEKIRDEAKSTDVKAVHAGTYDLAGIFTKFNSDQITEKIKSGQMGDIFSDRKTLESYNKATVGKNLRQKQDIAAQFMMADQKKSLRPGFSNSHMYESGEESAQYIEGQTAILDQKRGLEKLVQEGKIDFDSYHQNIAALTQEASVNKFDRAVEEFVRGVAVMNGADPKKLMAQLSTPAPTTSSASKLQGNRNPH